MFIANIFVPIHQRFLSHTYTNKYFEFFQNLKEIAASTVYSSRNVRNPSTRQHFCGTHGVMYPIYKLYNSINKAPNKARIGRAHMSFILIRTGTGNALLIRTDPGNALLIRAGSGNAILIRTGPGNILLIRTGPGNALLIRTGLGNALLIRTGPGNALLITSLQPKICL